VREIVRRGHYVGTHTMDHIQLPLVSTADMTTQVDQSADLIEGITGVRPIWVRPPGGSRSPRVDGYLARTGFTQMLWNLGTGDFQVRSSDDVLTTFRRVLERREAEAGERGGIVLLHDIHAWSVEAFPRIVAYLDQRNCALLEQGEELFDFVDDPALFYQRRSENDDASTVAPIVTLDEGMLEVRQARARIRAEARCANPEALSRLVRGPAR
jgi:peptidoglycan/xylan/chitin deacetylase (PgdA/CDA1 family)